MADESRSASKEFLAALCRYYSEFLETDFHANRPPSRRIISRDNNGIVRSVSLKHYPEQQQSALRLLRTKLQENTFTNVARPSETVALGLDYSTTSDQAPTFYGAVFELWKNKEVLDKNEFYLYLYDITYERNTFPIFYVSISVERDQQGSFHFDFDPVLLINKKALQFVSEKHAAITGKSWRIKLPQRHVYLNNFDHAAALAAHLQIVVDEAADFFGLSHPNILTPNEYSQSRDGVTITNCCYLSLSDKSDEALLTDYENILALLDRGENDQAVTSFQNLSDHYLFKNPDTFDRAVDMDYEAQDLGTKLSYQSPVPLNSE